MAKELSKTDAESIEKAMAGVRQANDEKDDVYRRDILHRRANEELTDDDILKACSQYQRNWVSRTVSQASPRVVDSGRKQHRPVRFFGLHHRSDLNERRGVLIRTEEPVD